MTSESQFRASIIVNGQVQGVGFRYATLREANRLNLSGFVKNLPNATVYMEAEGSLDSVNSLIEWAKTGPRLASVDAVDFTFLPVRGYAVFQIR